MRVSFDFEIKKTRIFTEERTLDSDKSIITLSGNVFYTDGSFGFNKIANL